MWRFIFLLTLTAASPAWAERYQLFIQAAQAVPDYDQIVERLQPGDELVFSNGKSFVLEERLGHGKTTLVLAVRGAGALRIPLHSGLFRESTPYTAWITEFLRAYPRLVEGGVAVVKTFPNESLEGEYALVERLQIRFTLEQFLEGHSMLKREEAKVVWESLLEFARGTWKFSRIGDFASMQLGWVGDRWVLFDFTNTMRSYRTAPQDTVFDGLEISSFRAATLVRAILAERVRADPEHCERLLKRR